MVEPQAIDDDAENENLWELFIRGISSFFQLMSDGRLVEVFIRIGIFIGLVFVVHAFFVWALHSVVIPLLQKYFMDHFFDELKKKLMLGNLQQYNIDWDLGRTQSWWEKIVGSS